MRGALLLLLLLGPAAAAGATLEVKSGAAEETPAEETPAEETPAEETPAEEAPAEETPAEETPKEETPEEEGGEEEKTEAKSLPPATPAPVTPAPCDEDKAVLMDLKVTNCYIEEGAVRTPDVLKQQMTTFLSTDLSIGVWEESFAAPSCVKKPEDPPCRCLVSPGDQCIKVTPMYSQGACTKAHDAETGTLRPTGQPFEVCVNDSKREEFEIALPTTSYLFRITSSSLRAEKETPALLSLSADGCVMTPAFDTEIRTYGCSVNCEVGGHALIGAVRDVIDDYAISVLTESSSGGPNPWTVVATDPHTIATEVMLDTDLAPKHVRIMLGDKVYVGDQVGFDSAISFYTVTIQCAGQFMETTGSTTTPHPGTVTISSRDFEIETLLLVGLFSTIAILACCTVGRTVISRLMLKTVGSDDLCSPCTRVITMCFTGRKATTITNAPPPAQAATPRTAAPAPAPGGAAGPGGAPASIAPAGP